MVQNGSGEVRIPPNGLILFNCTLSNPDEAMRLAEAERPADRNGHTRPFRSRRRSSSASGGGYPPTEPLDPTSNATAGRAPGRARPRFSGSSANRRDPAGVSIDRPLRMNDWFADAPGEYAHPREWVAPKPALSYAEPPPAHRAARVAGLYDRRPRGGERVLIHVAGAVASRHPTRGSAARAVTAPCRRARGSGQTSARSRHRYRPHDSRPGAARRGGYRTVGGEGSSVPERPPAPRTHGDHAGRGQRRRRSREGLFLREPNSQLVESRDCGYRHAEHRGGYRVPFSRPRRLRGRCQAGRGKVVVWPPKPPPPLTLASPVID